MHGPSDAAWADTVPGMAATRVTIVSDTHLSASAEEAEANWGAVLRYVGAAAPDVVLHLGDLSLDGAHNPDDLHHARRQLDRLPVAWHAVPGNHDIGDNPSPGARESAVVDADRHRRWIDIVGPDHWALSTNGWTLLAINAQLFESGLEAEARQWSWLEERLGERRDGDRTALITHKPVAAADVELAASPPYRFVPPRARRRLGELLGNQRVTLVISGHVHQHRVLHLDGTDHIWAPTTWAVLPDEVQPRLGAKRCGVLSLELDADERARPQLVEPDGIAQLMLVRDLPSPYRR